jgi:hypothetical protein
MDMKDRSPTNGDQLQEHVSLEERVCWTRERVWDGKTARREGID